MRTNERYLPFVEDPSILSLVSIPYFEEKFRVERLMRELFPRGERGRGIEFECNSRVVVSAIPLAPNRQQARVPKRRAEFVVVRALHFQHLELLTNLRKSFNSS
ncbi:hypothetical protein HAX54_051784 [Datura stramonium]|uniref:Uncharacterized protein n=1 Tax=Datura stramonium TaxID=4076 RepID=A0ABS8SY32_DATST|nr:hypothetical protein [Datura stramonium]